MTTPTTIADAVRQLIKTDNDAPRLIAEALQEIPELGLITPEEVQGLSDTIDEQANEIANLEDLLAEAREGGDE